MSRQIALATLLVLPLAACGAAPEDRALEETSSRIIGGAVDAGDPAVVMVYAESPQGGAGFCTGTVIAPRAVLTAAHCGIMPDTPFPCAGSQCVASDPHFFTILGGTNPTVSPDWQRSVKAVLLAPDVDFITTSAHDVAVLLLEEDAPVAPLPWHSSDPGVYATGTTFIAVGYGMDAIDPATAGAGVKRSVQLAVRDSDPHQFLFGSSSMNVYEGDSGGPAIANGVVIGTTSYGFGDANGELESADMRTDDNAAFIAAAIAASEPAKHEGALAGCSVAGLEGGNGASPLVLAFLALATIGRRRAR